MSGPFSRLVSRWNASSPPASGASETPAAPGASAASSASSSPPGLAELFSADHRACDERWPEVEAAVGTAALADAFDRFDAGMRAHLAAEEDHLFPAFEQATGMIGHGPTVVMRGEHDQMRALLDQMGDAVRAGDTDALLDLGDTLAVLVQQHNIKEEGMLYPMASQVLARRWPELHALVAPVLRPV